MAEKSDIYYTLEKTSEGFIKDRGSKFYAYAFPTISIDEVETALADIRKLHNKARHHCYAYRLGTDGNNFRANDDGEPSGTAGKPILGQFDSFNITDVLIIVVRYFGGTLLGTGGLIQAYRTAAEEALKAANIIEKTLKNRYYIHFDYSLMAPVMNAVKKLDLEVLGQTFEESAYISVAIPISVSENQLNLFKANVLGISFDQVDADTKIGGMKIVPF
mgnify:CR=1 FL=1